MSGIKWLHNWNKLRFYFSFLLLAFYLVVGGLFLFTNQWADLLPKGRYITGIILTLFGILRFYIAYKRYANRQLKIKEKKLLKVNAKQQQ
jgi:cytochrome c biogenesis protein CcdA